MLWTAPAALGGTAAWSAVNAQQANKLPTSNTCASLARIAGTIGYEPEAAFSRAFKKEFGTSPATWRRTSSG
jgi:AraC-like DNA-binding protein